MICGIDIGGTYTRIGLVDHDLTIHAFEKHPSTLIIENFSVFLKEYISRHHPPSQIVIGFPGVVNPQSKKIMNVPNLKAAETLDIQQLENALKIPIHINKDTHHLFLSDQHALGVSNIPNVLAFYLGTGLGFVIYLNHQIITGDEFIAGELGHQKLKGIDAPCQCGLRGCYETICSGWYLKNLHQNYFKEIPLDQLFEAYTHSTHRSYIDQFIDDFAFVIASQLNLFGVKHAIIGGGIPQMKGFPKETLENLVKNKIRHPALKPIKLYFSESDDNQGVIGAALIQNFKGAI